MNIGVVQFPGSNCDRDVFEAVQSCGHSASWLWHLDLIEDSKKLDAIVLPGGFSYGDYLRAGALAARSPVMKSVAERSGRGVPVLGICNGFQVLCESGLLPGALLRNASLRFIDDWAELEVVNQSKFWDKSRSKSEKFKLPIAHGEGRFFAPEEMVKELEDNAQVWLRYTNNPNGSIHDIAGVTNKAGNVAGLMPHPERASEAWLGGIDGRGFFEIQKGQKR
jgi:phosphoribosylformylglycinamidine synthase subunit PurQ / glutaminase